MESIGADAAFMAAAAGKAFVTLMEPHRLMYLMAGCMMGLVLGIVPGIGGLAGTAMLLPFTFGMDPYSAFALLLGLGATTATGDPIPAILFGVPGGAASAATVLDGFPMAKRGEAGRALSAAYMSSMMGGIFGAMLLAVSIPILRPVMLYLGSPELLAFSVLGISMVAVLSGSAPLRGVAAGCLEGDRQGQHLQRPVAGREGLLRQLVADRALLMDRRRHRLDPRHQRLGG